MSANGRQINEHLGLDRNDEGGHPANSINRPVLCLAVDVFPMRHREVRSRFFWWQRPPDSAMGGVA